MKSNSSTLKKISFGNGIDSREATDYLLLSENNEFYIVPSHEVTSKKLFLNSEDLHFPQLSSPEKIWGEFKEKIIEFFNETNVIFLNFFPESEELIRTIAIRNSIEFN